MCDCAILAIASTTQTVRALLQRLVKDSDVLDDPVVPWTIVNKYYTAEVKFLVHTPSSWAQIRDELTTPAVLFVWNKGEPYRDEIRKLSQHASQHEFEVALGIRLPLVGSIEVEDDQDVDAYLSSKGFEFVDVPDIDVPSPGCSGILGVPRVIDALSTIMWPSMVRQSSKRVTTFDSINPGLSSDDYHNLVRLVGEKISGNDGDHMQRELEELERWLDEDTLSSEADAPSAGGEDDEIPWSTAVTPGTLSPSSSGFLENSRPTTPKAGFDDDFASFVSAPSSGSAGISLPLLESLSSPKSPKSLPHLASTSFSSTFSFSSACSGRSTPTFDDHASIDATRLVPGESYKSLGSMSDLGEPDKDPVTVERLSDSSGEDLPSQAEIAETSRRIFGAALPLSLSPTKGDGGNPHAMPALGGESARGHLGEEPDGEMAEADLERFDLQGVLGALQGLKEEIAAMPNKERRKAAARVALGLAYGLGDNAHSEEEDV